MPKRKPTKHEDDILRNIRQPDRYDPKARSIGGPWRMVKCKDGAYVCYEQHLEIIDNLRKNAENDTAQSPHDGIHTCSKGCKKLGCNRGLRDTIEEQDAQIVALKQDLLEKTADHRKTCRRRIHDLNLIQSLKEDIESLTGQVRQFEEHRDIASQIIKRLETEARSQFANSEQENARLKAEVERLTERNKFLEQIDSYLQGANENAYEKRCDELEADVERLTAELSNISGWGRGLESDLSHARVEISFLKSEIERLTKLCQATSPDGFIHIRDIKAAKEGKPSV